MSRSTFLLSLMESVDLLRPVMVDDKIESQTLEWEKIERGLGVLDAVAKKLVTRIVEAGPELDEIIKASEDQSYTVRKSLDTFNKRNSPSAKYQTVFLKALEETNTAMRKSIEAYKAGCTTDDVMKSVKLTDPDMEECLQSLKTTAIDELTTQFDAIDSLPNKPVSEGFVDAVMKLINAAKHGLEKVTAAFERSEKLVNKLSGLSKKDGDSRGNFLTPPSEDEVW